MGTKIKITETQLSQIIEKVVKKSKIRENKTTEYFISDTDMKILKNLSKLKMSDKEKIKKAMEIGGSVVKTPKN
tara:strand:+ start:386 stop:607 length:222 start_codon:yes stop_codon:yes gene_type:complete